MTEEKRDIFYYMTKASRKENVSDEDLKEFSPYIAMKFLSYHANDTFPALKISNILNKYIFHLEKRDVFTFLKTVMPKSDKFFMKKMCKRKDDEMTKNDIKLLKCIVYHYECSESEAKDMLQIMSVDWRNQFLETYNFLFNRK